MKTLILGTLAFLVWSSSSTYFYVCQIKNLCYETAPTQAPVPDEEIAMADSPDNNLPEVEDHDEEADEAEETEALIANPGTFTVHHGFDQASFDHSNDFSQYTDQMMKFIQQSPGTIHIIGHTDNIGPDNYNFYLGKLRAEEVKKYILAEGVDLSLISTESQGEAEPQNSNATREGRALNRRTEIIIQE